MAKKTAATKKKAKVRENLTLGWHWINGDRTLSYAHDKRKASVGVAMKAKKESIYYDRVAVCAYGMHMSSSPMDAFFYHAGPMICRVECWGEMSESTKKNPLGKPDKAAFLYRKVLWMADASDAIHKFSVWLARRILNDLLIGRDGMDPAALIAMTPTERLMLKATVEAATTILDAMDGKKVGPEAVASATRSIQSAYVYFYSDAMFRYATAMKRLAYLAGNTVDGSDYRVYITRFVGCLQSMCGAGVPGAKELYVEADKKFTRMLSALKPKTRRRKPAKPAKG